MDRSLLKWRQAGIASLAIIVSCLLALPAAGQTTNETPSQVIKLTVSPAAAPRGALRMRLLPEYLDRTPGNRAAMYKRAIILMQQVAKDPDADLENERDSWQSLPLSELPLDAMRKRLRSYGSVIREVQAAAWRDECDWGLRLRELKGVEPITLLLPEVQECRQLARALSLKCRVEIAEGRLNDAHKTLQTMFQLAVDVTQTPTLINGLVGMAIAAVANNELQAYMTRGEAPNLYWALTTLPRPLIDLREALEQERSMPLQLIPALRDIDKPRAPEEWRAALLEGVRVYGTVEGSELRSDAWAELAVTALLLKGYPTAKRALIEKGRDPKAVEAMPAGQVVALHVLDDYHYAWGEAFKPFYLPYPESAREYQRVEKRLREERYLAPAGHSTEVIPLAGLLLPAIGAVIHAQVRTDRQIAELRCIEALRMHAAERGAWPQSLSEITAVPVPDDPATGKPFQYRLQGGQAILDSVTAPHMPQGHGRRFELTLRPREKK